ncbi:RagB/SusD family nutrient uptake outer membrane protein [Marinoscillum luteum]|uniref:RagB/SusD family nutrient uptake outer membrane protein n=1 Tax=Marinoscillum luteum TaxID=861051 RepID=A0ABW7N792_9BACT
MQKTIKRSCWWLLIALSTAACQDHWLEIKSDKQLVIPTSLKDLQALLDNTSEMNFSTTPSLGEVGTTDYYLADEDWQALSSEEQRNAYRWDKTIFAGESCFSWNYPYKSILNANLALEGLARITQDTGNEDAWNNIRGSALFYRSWAFFQLAQVFCKPYAKATALSDLGIPLRLESDINIRSERATVQRTYDQIIADVWKAVEVLPDEPLVQTRPGKAAGYALLAKAYLHMNNYDSALSTATQCLRIANQLMDYNQLDSAADYPFAQMNEEVIFLATMSPLSALFRVMHVDAELYGKYAPGDLRKALFYQKDEGRVSFKGTYDGSIRLFSGLAVDEVMLLKAEAEARLGALDDAMNTLNTLLITRWESGTYEPLTAESETQAQQLIMEERHKSLPYRGIRWMDLRRIANEPALAVTLHRQLEGQMYTLEPGDPRYVLPIPDEVIELSGMPQNPR